MTRENAKNIAEAISFKTEGRQRLSLPGANELIDQIFNDHEAQLKALQQHRSCEGCKYCTKVFSYTYPLCTRDEQSPFQIHNKEVLACRSHEAKEQ